MARRSPVLLAVLFAWAFIGVATSAHAIDSMYPDDPNRQIKEGIEDAYGMYILLPSRRNAKEKVEIQDDNVEFWVYYDPRKPDLDKMKCEALSWVTQGRFGSANAGPKVFFERFPKYKTATLVVYRLNSERTLEKDGKYVVKKDPFVYLRLGLSRTRSEKLDYKAIHELISRSLDPKNPDPAGCVKAGAAWVDTKWFSKEYFK